MTSANIAAGRCIAGQDFNQGNIEQIAAMHDLAGAGGEVDLMAHEYKERCHGAARFLQATFGAAPQISITAGSGLSGLIDQLRNIDTVHFAEIPGFPVSKVEGHAGEMIVGELNGVRVVGQKGRVHMYEGHAACDAALPVRALALWGIRDFIITNAAGSLKSSATPGDLMAITSDYSFGIESSSQGIHGEEFGPQFFDVTRPYDTKLVELFTKLCARLEVPMYCGSYVMTAGPRYESAAEILDLVCRRNLMLATDSPELAFGAVGMSTVPEVHALAQMRAGGTPIQVLGVSMISNMAAGISKTKLNHTEVLEMGKIGGERLGRVLNEFVPALVNPN